MSFHCKQSRNSTHNQLKISSLEKELQKLKTDSLLKHASIGFYADYVKNSDTLARLNAGKNMSPASVLKLFTTGAALDLLGKNHRFSTTLYSSSENFDSDYHGDLIIRGGGDLALGSRMFRKHYYSPESFLAEWIDSLKAKGITSVKGNLIVDVSIFDEMGVPGTWPWEDIGNYYGAGVSGLSYRDNSYKIIFSSPSTAGKRTDIIDIKPEIRGMDITNYVRSSNEQADKAYIYAAPDAKSIKIRGTIPKNRSRFSIRGAMPNPGLQLGRNFKKLLNANNIRCSGDVQLVKQPDKLQYGKEIAVTKSPKLIEIIRKTHYSSVNLFAEHLLRHIGLSSGKSASLENSIKALKVFWESNGLNPHEMMIYDGCGLSRFNAVSARQVVEALKYMHSGSSFGKEFYNSLPVAGKQGTVKYFCNNTGAEGELLLKSGSMDNVIAYAGYTNNPEDTLAFSIMVTNYPGESHAVREKLENFMQHLVQ